MFPGQKGIRSHPAPVDLLEIHDKARRTVESKDTIRDPNVEIEVDARTIALIRDAAAFRVDPGQRIE